MVIKSPIVDFFEGIGVFRIGDLGFQSNILSPFGDFHFYFSFVFVIRRQWVDSMLFVQPKMLTSVGSGE